MHLQFNLTDSGTLGNTLRAAIDDGIKPENKPVVERGDKLISEHRLVEAREPIS